MRAFLNGIDFRMCSKHGKNVHFVVMIGKMYQQCELSASKNSIILYSISVRAKITQTTK